MSVVMSLLRKAFFLRTFAAANRNNVTMVKGKSTCKTLKAIRKQIAEANDIKYEPHECHYDGPCLGTCPACEAEVRYLENQLGLRRRLGRAVSLIGISAGLFSACHTSTERVEALGPSSLKGMMPAEVKEAEQEVMVVGKVAVPERADTTRFADSDNPEASIFYLPLELPIEKVDTTKVFGDVAEQMPCFPGGDAKLMEYLREHTRYPEGYEGCAQGRVIVTFVVERDGSIAKPKVIRSLDPMLDKEALRVVSGMPKWLPGRQNGLRVAVKYTLPITFRLE